MSWDVQLMKPDGPLGAADEVRAAISAVHPRVDWTDPTWGTLDGGPWHIELNTGSEPVIQSIMLHVRGSGDPIPAIMALCHRNDWRAFDLAEGDFLDEDEPSPDGWQDFQAFRDQIQGTSLPYSKLQIVGTTLQAQRLGRVVSHDLTNVTNVRFERATNSASIVLGVIAVAIGVVLKMFIPIAWLAWIGLIVPLVPGVVFFATARADWLVFEEAGKTHRYILTGSKDEIAAFRDNVVSIAKAD